ncbi:TetR/AcrR family transcriptional regulator [Marisediminicola senii]|uniref:TetR/AcrR family transcriptional regulator n=1 Tax=Marisediminicola senii TaxID=2711233 RepID=UPI0013ED0DF5|nr:TetR/AcrR family transcriptional regulator [Marisediminicola senii]
MSSTPRLPRRDARENRALLLDAALRVLTVDPDAPLDAIAAEAGLTRRAVYGHFTSRDELVEEALAAGASRVTATLQPVDDSDPLLAIATIASSLWGQVSQVRARAQLAVRGPYRARIDEILRPLRDLLEHITHYGIQGGTMRSDVSAATLARLIEGAVLSVLDEATRTGLDAEEGDRLVIIAALSTAGLSYVDAAAYVPRVHAELAPAAR